MVMNKVQLGCLVNQIYLKKKIVSRGIHVQVLSKKALLIYFKGAIHAIVMFELWVKWVTQCKVYCYLFPMLS